MLHVLCPAEQHPLDGVVKLGLLLECCIPLKAAVRAGHRPPGPAGSCRREATAECPP